VNDDLAEALTQQTKILESIDEQLWDLPRLVSERRRTILLIGMSRAVLGEPPFVDTFDYERFERWMRKIKPLLVGWSTPHEAEEPTEAKP
jgi:hypothetical protein